MFAIAEVGSKQYKVIKDEILCIPRVSKKSAKGKSASGGKEISLNRVLLIVDGKDVKIGAPYIKGAKVVCEILADIKGPKRIAFKFRRRKSSQKKTGHRELLSRVRVKDIAKG